MVKDYLQIHNLSCGYGKNFRLDGINISLPKGVFAGVIGSNGSGKSTLFKGIVGDLHLLSGSVNINGENLSNLSLKQKARSIAVVSPTADVTPMTVEEYVLMGRIPHQKPFQFTYNKADREIAANYMELAGITHLQHKHLNELSSGQQQMATIACALTQQPSLLLLDEPTSHLDITFQVKIMNLLKRLIEENQLTVLMIVHDLNLASTYCNRLILMKGGKVLRQGSPSEVITKESIAQAYEMNVAIAPHPDSGNPMIFIS